MSDGKFNMFSRSYEYVGKENADFCIKTKGKVKIKWGNKYIDLIKDGKVNADVDIIKKVDTLDDIPLRDGIYVTDEGEVVLVVDGVKIPVVQSDSDTSYVSYNPQEGKTSEQRVNAQNNIGIQFETLELLTASGLQSGIVFITSENAIYTVSSGVATKLETGVPDVITKPVHVLINGGSYSMFLEGFYSENGNRLVIGKQGNSLDLYAEQDYKVIESDAELRFIVDGSNIMTVSRYNVTVNNNLLVKSVETNTVKSEGGSKDIGFLLTYEDGESTLYIDNVVERNDEESSIVDTTADEMKDMIDDALLVPGTKYRFKYMNEWDMTEERLEGSVDSSGLYLFVNAFHIVVTAISATQLSKYAYFEEHPEWTLEYEAAFDEINIPDYDPMISYGRIIGLTDEYGNYANYDFKHLMFYINGEWKYTYQYIDESMLTSNENDDNTTVPYATCDASSAGFIRNTKITVDWDILKREDFPNRAYTLGGDMIVQMIGKFEDNEFGLMKESAIIGNKDIDTKNNTVIADSINQMELTGGFTGNTIKYTSITKLISNSLLTGNRFLGEALDQEFLETSDCVINGDFSGNTVIDGMKRCYFRGDFTGISLTQAGSDIFIDEKSLDVYVFDGELRTIRMPDTVFPGMIVMYDGRKPVPTGWAMCDGSNGTPDLTDKYIKGGTTAGTQGGNPDNEVTIQIENLPPHTHEIAQGSSATTSLNGSHSHGLPYSDDGKEVDHGNDYQALQSGSGIRTANAGEHTHSVDLSGVTLTETGEGVPMNIEPEYYTLIFIMYIGYSDAYY